MRKFIASKQRGFQQKQKLQKSIFDTLTDFFFTCHNYSNAFQEKKEGKAVLGLCNMGPSIKTLEYFRGRGVSNSDVARY